MINRKQKIEELLESFGSLRRSTTFRGIDSAKMPRITPSQWGVLMLIGQRGKSSVKDVAGALRISSSATTQLVDGLVRSGYLVRDKDVKDRRAVLLTLSKSTKKQVEKMKQQWVQRFLKVFGVLTDKEFNQYCVLHKKIVQRFLNKS